MLLTIRTKNSKKNIPFGVRSAGAELILEVDELVLNAVLDSVKDTTPKPAQSEDNLSVTSYTRESLLALKEFPAQYVKFLPPQVLDMFSSKEDFRNSLSDNLKGVQDQYRKALQSLQEAYKAKEVKCPTCEQGKLNRTFIPLIISAMFSEDDQKWMVDMMNCGLQTFNSTLKIEFTNENIKLLNDEYVSEFKKAISNPQGCTQCAKNGIHTKYAAKLMEIARDHNNNFKPKD